ncbi:hypothetical protein ACTL6U_03235 [Rhodovibrionaceae bacterium A322]
MKSLKKTRFAPIAALAAASVILSGCITGAGVTGPTYISSIYSQDMVLGVSAQGGMGVKVEGQPFNDPQETVNQQIAQIFTQSNFGRRFEVFANPPAELKTAYRTYVVFNPAPNLSDDRVCEEAPNLKRADPVPGKVSLLAVFCEFKTAQTSTFGRVEADSLQDPRYQGLLRQVAHELWPPIKSDIDRADNQSEWPF